MSDLRKKISLLISLLILVSALTYAYRIEPRWIEITTHVIGQPTSDPIKIIQLTDLHLDSDTDYQKQVVDSVLALEPDIIVLSGDVVDDPEHLKTLKTFLKQLSNVKIIATLGNWEYWSNIDIEQLQQIYSEYNTSLLVNAEHAYEIHNRKIRFLGLDDYTAGKPSFGNFRSTIPDTVSVLIQHSPGLFDDEKFSYAKHHIKTDLCLAGHTHGGQITLFGKILYTPQGSGHFTEGLYQTDMCPMYVSKGVGTSLIPIRFGSRPEIALFFI